MAITNLSSHYMYLPFFFSLSMTNCLFHSEQYKSVVNGIDTLPKNHSKYIHNFGGATGQLGPSLPIFGVSRSHTIRHTHPVGLPWTSNQLVADAATYTTNTKRRTSMLSVGFEPAIPAIKRLHTYALDHTAAGIGHSKYYRSKFENGASVVISTLLRCWNNDPG